MNTWLRRLSALPLVAALALGAPGASLAAPAGGLEIDSSGTCLIRQGGHQGYRVVATFAWLYPDLIDLGPQLTVGGTYSVQLRNPASGAFETVLALPYGFVLDPNAREERAHRISPRDPHWVFDQVRLETTWRIEQTGAAGTQVTMVDCERGPIDAGLEPIAPPTTLDPSAPTPTSPPNG